MSNKQFAWPWSVPLAVHDMPAEGLERRLVADAAARSGVAALAGVPEIARLDADLAATPHGAHGVRITGQVSATVGQICVVTLEPMQSEVNEPVDVLYLRNPPENGPAAGQSEEEPGKIGDERIEALIGESVDLGAVATEFLILGIDPHPRRTEAVFAPPAADTPPSSPFAALAALRKRSGEGGGG